MSIANIFRLFALCLIVFAIASAYAGDDHKCQGGHNCTGDTNVDVSTVVGTTVNAGDVNVQGGDLTGGTMKSNSRSIGLSNGLGDVDIAGCLGSVQYGTPVWSKQKLTLNWVCMAEFYLRNQKYELAAMAICNTEVRSEFDTEDDCRAAHDFSAPYVEAPASIEAPDEHQEEIDDLYEQVAILVEQVNKPAPKPVVTQRVVQQPFLSEEKRAALAELKK